MPQVEAERAWAAGFFDGEGSVSSGMRVEKRNDRASSHRWVSLSLAQSDPRPLRRFAAIVGVGKVNGPYNAKNKNSQPYFVFQVGNIAGVERILDVVGPWLSEPKAEAFALALATYAEHGPALCEHGERRGRCKVCRGEWTRQGWEKRRLAHAR